MNNYTEDREEACKSIGKARLCKNKLENAMNARNSKEQLGIPRKTSEIRRKSERKDHREAQGKLGDPR